MILNTIERADIKDTVVQDILFIIESLRITNDDDDMKWCYNICIDDMIRNINYYKEGEYNEWLKKLKN